MFAIHVTLINKETKTQQIQICPLSMQLWDIFKRLYLSRAITERRARGENTRKIHLQLLSQPNSNQRNTPANLRTIIQLGKTCDYCRIDMSQATLTQSFQDVDLASSNPHL